MDNMAAAAAVGKDLGISGKTIEEALRGFKGMPGRMEFITRGPFTVVVDYAHTPDSLRAVYDSLKEELKVRHRQGAKLLCVLGSAGGGRDKWKRSEMGKIASESCDEIFLTDEDPYDEDPHLIISAIKSGIYGRISPDLVHDILDRREAIRRAVFSMREDDMAVITGKGSEEWIHVKRGRKIPWSDRRVVENVLKER
ncbi:MAG: cyanophycin synthetase [Patescibacteria group bacterium]